MVFGAMFESLRRGKVIPVRAAGFQIQTSRPAPKARPNTHR